MASMVTRRYPRAFIREACELIGVSGEPIERPAWIWSAAREGLGLLAGPDGGPLPPILTVKFSVGIEAVELPVRIVWQAPAATGWFRAGARLRLTAATPASRALFASWLTARIGEQRADALRVGAQRALARQVSLRTLQAALDAQRVAGGDIEPMLQEDTSDNSG